MSASPGLLLVRADAGPEIGIGHVMRCLALAQAWQEAGGTAAFASAVLPESLQKRLEHESCTVHRPDAAAGSADDLEATRRIAASTAANWLVLDGYRFGSAFQKGMRDGRWRVLCIDDDARHDSYQTDIILNQNLGASAANYAGRAPQSRLLLGCEYAMLRREFRALPRVSRTAAESVKRILITLGGADPANVTQPILEACLSALPDCELHAVIGPANPHERVLREFVENGRQRVVLHMAPSNLPELMAGSDLAISAAGSSVYEFGYLGVPMLILVTAENQRQVAAHLERLRAAVRIDDEVFKTPTTLAAAIRAFVGDPVRRAACARSLQALIDGRGATRVVAAMR